jgi:5-methylcytosine-specific restriction endonuclease McrA
MTVRLAMTKKRRAEAFLACRGRCVACGERLTGDYQVDHRVPLALGGSEAVENLECLHVECHSAKTKTDVKRIAKAVRIAKKNGLQPWDRKPRKPIPSRPLQSRGFNPNLRKRMSGVVEVRR